jgi:superfamily II DNA or RNA helicase
MKDRAEVQSEALEKLKEAHGIGTLRVGTGVGKSKIVCDFINYFKDQMEKVLIIVPLTSLVKNWEEELNKWMDKGWEQWIYIETIQGIYKDHSVYATLVVYDEVHTICTPAYSAVFNNIRSIFKIGLTATTDVFRKEDKQALYDLHIPIIYEYLDGEKDGILNKTKFTVIEHELDNNFKYYVKRPKHSFVVPEKEQYEKLSGYMSSAEILMADAGSTNYFKDAAIWMAGTTGDPLKTAAARKYLWSVRVRREFLLGLRSSREITKALTTTLLQDKKNKILIFSELTEQARKITGDYTVYGKQKKAVNSELIRRFNEGEFRALGSCYSLTLGMNMVGVNKAIIETFNGSDVKATQRIGRLHRLSADQTADIYFLKIKNTQSEVWFNSMSRELEVDNFTILTSQEVFNGKY